MRNTLPLITALLLAPLAALHAAVTVEASKASAGQSASVTALPTIPLAEKFRQPPNAYRMILYSDTVVAEPWTCVTDAFDPGFRLQLKADAVGLLAVRYRREDGHLYYLVNSLPEKELRVNVSGPSWHKVHVCNPNDGTITEVSIPGEVAIGGFNSVFLLD